MYDEKTLSTLNRYASMRWATAAGAAIVMVGVAISDDGLPKHVEYGVLALMLASALALWTRRVPMAVVGTLEFIANLGLAFGLVAQGHYASATLVSLAVLACMNWIYLEWEAPSEHALRKQNMPGRET